jgi:hypothetical protein
VEVNVCFLCIFSSFPHLRPSKQSASPRKLGNNELADDLGVSTWHSVAFRSIGRLKEVIDMKQSPILSFRSWWQQRHCENTETMEQFVNDISSPLCVHKERIDILRHAEMPIRPSNPIHSHPILPEVGPLGQYRKIRHRGIALWSTFPGHCQNLNLMPSGKRSSWILKNLKGDRPLHLPRKRGSALR